MERDNDLVFHPIEDEEIDAQALPVKVEEKPVSLGLITGRDARDLVASASNVATELARVIKTQQLYVEIKSGDRVSVHVKVEGWLLLASMVGISPVEEEVRELEDGSYEATVKLLSYKDGREMVVGRASAICGMDEARWANAPRYARRSMAITRATAKALRQKLGWVVSLAGYDPTPAEEMMDLVIEEPAVTVESKPAAPAAAAKPSSGRGPSEKQISFLQTLAERSAENRKVMNEYLRSHGKKKITDLTRREASALIDKLTKEEKNEEKETPAEEIPF